MLSLWRWFLPPGGCFHSCCPLIGPWCPREGAMTPICTFLVTPCVQDHADCILVDLTSPVTWLYCWYSVTSFLAKKILYRAVRRCPARSSFYFQNRTSCLLWVTQPGKINKLIFLITVQRRGEERDGEDWAQWSSGYLQCQLYTKGAILGCWLGGNTAGWRENYNLWRDNSLIWRNERNKSVPEEFLQKFVSCSNPVGAKPAFLSFPLVYFTLIIQFQMYRTAEFYSNILFIYFFFSDCPRIRRGEDTE